MEIGIFTRVYQDMSADKAFKMIKKNSIKNIEITANRNSLHLDLDSALQLDYMNKYESLLEDNKLTITAISIHRDTQLVLGPHGESTNHFYYGSKEDQINFGIKRARLAAQVAKEYKIPLVVGLLGSNDFTQWYEWPFKEGWKKEKEIAKSRWLPILEFYDKLGVKFAHEIGLQQIAYNLETAEEVSQLFNINSFGFCIDPANMMTVGIEPSIAIERLGEKVLNVHGKDIEFTCNLSTSGWMPHGDINRRNRGWRFRVPGWGDVRWKKLLTSLKSINYNGVISLEIDDAFMNNEEAIKKSMQFLEPLLYE